MLANAEHWSAPSSPRKVSRPHWSSSTSEAHNILSECQTARKFLHRTRSKKIIISTAYPTQAGSSGRDDDEEFYSSTFVLTINLL